MENGRTDILNRKSEYYENKKYIFHIILTAGELGLEYNKLQLTVIVKLKISNWYKKLK